MSLDDQLTELLAGLGVVLENSSSDESATSSSLSSAPRSQQSYEYEQPRYSFGQRETGALAENDLTMNDDMSWDAPSDISLFQTSREHYGVFYRLDLSQGVPHLRIYLPEDDGYLKVRCYLVRAALTTPLHQWFVSTQAHKGSGAYEDMRDTAQQHLLFAAGELMKRLFWAGSIESMCFPHEIEVLRLV